jgi:hypothetical protein
MKLKLIKRYLEYKGFRVDGMFMRNDGCVECLMNEWPQRAEMEAVQKYFFCLFIVNVNQMVFNNEKRLNEKHKTLLDKL